MAALRYTTTVAPIVAIGGDLLAEGLVASLARLGSNVTGVLQDTAAKRVTLL